MARAAAWTKTRMALVYIILKSVLGGVVMPFLKKVAKVVSCWLIDRLFPQAMQTLLYTFLPSIHSH